MRVTKVNLGIGVAHFERYLGIVSELHEPKSANDECDAHMRLTLQLEIGFRALKNVLYVCGVRHDLERRNVLEADGDWQKFVVEVHDYAYNPRRMELWKYPYLIREFKPDPLIDPQVLRRLGRPGNFLIEHLMDGLPVSPRYVGVAAEIDAQRKEKRRHGSRGEPGAV